MLYPTELRAHVQVLSAEISVQRWSPRNTRELCTQRSSSASVNRKAGFRQVEAPLLTKTFF